MSLCIAHRRLKDFGQARIYGERALGLLRKTGERREEGWVLIELGRTCHDSWAYAADDGYWGQALAIFTEIGERRGEAWAHEHIS